MKKGIQSFVLLLLLGVGPSSCDSCDFIVLADLFAQTLLAPLSINFGQIAIAVAELANVRDDGECGEETAAAGETRYLWELFRKKDNSDEWEAISTDDEFQDELLAGREVNQSLPFTIVREGTYRLDYLTDYEDRVEERDEYANDEDTIISRAAHSVFTYDQSLRQTNNFISITFEVLDPDGDGVAEVQVIKD